MKLSSEWITRLLVIGALAAIIALPFALRRDRAPVLEADDVVVVITPHNEAIRSEFARGFQRWYRERTGRTVAVEWRVIGGTSEIARFLAGEYTSAFRLHWERDLGRRWSNEVLRAFNNGAIELDDTPQDDTEAERARRAFLASDVSCGIDVFFGGGVYDFNRQARAGQIVDCGILQRHPEWFTDDVIPWRHNGEIFWDRDGRWIGAVLASFGILYNRDALQRLGIEKPPTTWRDLTDPRFFGELALADPTKSGSIAKAFEMVIQREMQERYRALLARGLSEAEAEKSAVEQGWLEGLRVLQLMGANARYFTDSSQKPPIDVGQGDSAA
ncbi:MAG: iron ABC transporter substrate-binding protein, partial [Verrucomicrobia bacterium]